MQIFLYPSQFTLRLQKQKHCELPVAWNIDDHPIQARRINWIG
jgi:hypothetical protein